MHSEPISAAHQFGLRAIGRQEGNEFPSNLDSNFVQSCSGQNTFLITGVDGEVLEVGGLGIYTQRNFVGLRHSVLFYLQGSRPRSSILERDFNLQVIRLRQFPVRSNGALPCTPLISEACWYLRSRSSIGLLSIRLAMTCRHWPPPRADNSVFFGNAVPNQKRRTLWKKRQAQTNN